MKTPKLSQVQVEAVLLLDMLTGEYGTPQNLVVEEYGLLKKVASGIYGVATIGGGVATRASNISKSEATGRTHV